MKIYCDSRRNELDKFVGQDVWVKVRLYTTRQETWPCYVRILEKIPITIVNHTFTDSCRYIINRAEEWTVFEKTEYKASLESIMTHKFQYDSDRLKLVEPVTVLTTEELIDEYRSNQ